MKKYLIVLLGCWAISTSAQKTFPLQLKSPPQMVTMLSEGNISTQLNERDFAISPDGKEIYFTISTPKSTFQTIVFCRMTSSGAWTSPEVASFAGTFSDLEPAFSADGTVLFFASNRPTSGSEPKDFDIWKVTRSGNVWGEPVNVGPTINTEADEFYPSITKSGNLYFTAAYQGGPGREDIYVSNFKNGQYLKPLAMDTAINTKYYEFNAFVDPKEQFILFTSYGRRDDAGGGDLYISAKDGSGKWTAARNLKEINSKQLDYCPYVSPDGKSFFFTSERHELPVSFLKMKATVDDIRQSGTNTSNGTGNIYWVDFLKVFGKKD
jgi:Tol biopolymer transport system component